MKIPFMNLYRQNESIQPDLNELIANVIKTSSFIGGTIKDQFESDFAAYCQSKFCIGVGNGTDSLYIALRTLGIGKGDQVVTVANSFIASSESITQTGATPVFVDCNSKTYNIDLNLLESTLQKSKNIKAIIAVHLYGRICPMVEVMNLAKKYNISVIEDCAQAHGALLNGKRAGSFGDFGSFSFYPGKNLGALGDGGALVTNNEKLYTKAKMFANHGRLSKYDHEFEGINSRLDTLQAGVLSLKLKKLPQWTERRIQLANVYNEALSEFQDVVTLPNIPTKGEHVFHLYVVRSANRDSLQKYLETSGIATGVHYPKALPNLSAYSYLGHKPSDFSVASLFQSQILSLPLFPEMSDAEVNYTLETVSMGLRELS